MSTAIFLNEKAANKFANSVFGVAGQLHKQYSKGALIGFTLFLPGLGLVTDELVEKCTR